MTNPLVTCHLSLVSRLLVTRNLKINFDVLALYFSFFRICLTLKFVYLYLFLRKPNSAFKTLITNNIKYI
jgi:hypothetical protein